jgi:hypothetical protein
VLEERVAEPSRIPHRKLGDVQRLRELLATPTSNPLHADDLRIDSSILTPGGAAWRITEEIEARRSPWLAASVAHAWANERLRSLA